MDMDNIVARLLRKYSARIFWIATSVVGAYVLFGKTMYIVGTRYLVDQVHVHKDELYITGGREIGCWRGPLVLFLLCKVNGVFPEKMLRNDLCVYYLRNGKVTKRIYSGLGPRVRLFNNSLVCSGDGMNPREVIHFVISSDHVRRMNPDEDAALRAYNDPQRTATLSWHEVPSETLYGTPGKGVNGCYITVANKTYFFSRTLDYNAAARYGGIYRLTGPGLSGDGSLIYPGRDIGRTISGAEYKQITELPAGQPLSLKADF